MAEGKIVVNAAAVKEKQEQIRQHLTMFFRGVYEISEENRRLAEEWKGAAADVFTGSLFKELEKVEKYGCELRRLSEAFLEMEDRFQSCEAKVAQAISEQ